MPGNPVTADVFYGEGIAVSHVSPETLKGYQYLGTVRHVRYRGHIVLVSHPEVGNFLTPAARITKAPVSDSNSAVATCLNLSNPDHLPDTRQLGLRTWYSSAPTRPVYQLSHHVKLPQLDFTQFKRRKRGSPQVGGTG